MKNCVIVVNTYKNEALSLAAEIQTFLDKKGISASLIQFSGQSTVNESCFSTCDFAVSLGGDGTVLFTARFCASRRIPIFPVNLGEFGFIAGIQRNAWKESLSRFIDSGSVPVERNMIRVELIRNKEMIFSQTALNDAVISAYGAARIVMLDVASSGVSFGKFKADGIIVATATGSTAYSAAAGGPIVDPELDALILSPVCPFSLSNRPLVLPSTAELSVTVLPSRGTEVMLTCDGQVTQNALVGDVIRIRKAKETALLIGCDSDVFYAALRSKLNWSGGPLA